MKCLTHLLVVATAVLAIGQVNLSSQAQESKAADKAKMVDPSGTWRWETDRNGKKTSNQLKIEVNDKNEVVGTYYGMIDGLKSTKGTIEGNKLSLLFDVDRDEVKFKANYEATIKDDKATGTIVLSSDQGSTDIPWEAERSVELSDVVGEWQLRIDANGNVIEPKLTISQKGDEYVGTYDSEQISGLKVSNIRIEKNKLMFTVSGEFDGTTAKVDYVGRPYANKMQGNLEYDFNGNSGEAEFTAKRKPSDK